MLTHEQLGVLDDPDAHRKIIAGAGSGKTTVLIADIETQINDGRIDPARTIAITFTRRAGQQLQDRLGDKGIRLAYIGTSFRLAYCLLHQWGQRYAVVDDQDVEQIATMLADSSKMIGLTKPSRVAARITGDKARGKPSVADRWLENTVRHYMAQRRLLPVSDILTRFNKQCDQSENGDRRFLDWIQAGIRHVYWDEYQDTDPEEALMLTRIAPTTSFIIGDSRQAIYGFRGASDRYLLDARSSQHWLTLNFRSRPAIVAEANAICADSPPLVPYRDMVSECPTVVRLDARQSGKRLPPADYWPAIVSLITERCELPLHVLCRANAEIVAANRLLMQAGYTTAIASPAFDEYATPVWRTLFLASRYLLDAANEWIVYTTRNMNLDRLAMKGLPQTVGNLELAVYGTSHHSIKANKHDMTLLDFVAWYPKRDVQDLLPEDGQQQPQVLLSTAHAVKGLEMENVLVANIGHPRGFTTGSQDERCLYYVAVTRAKERLYLVET